MILEKTRYNIITIVVSRTCLNENRIQTVDLTITANIHKATTRGRALLGLGFGKFKRLTTIGLLCEILYTFVSVLVFGRSKSPQSGVVVHPKKN